jgi:hypothetical protein
LTHLSSHGLNALVGTALLGGVDTLCLQDRADMLMIALTIELGIRQQQGNGYPLVGGIGEGHKAAQSSVGPRRAVYARVTRRSTLMAMVHFSQWCQIKPGAQPLTHLTKKVLIAPGVSLVASMATVAGPSICGANHWTMALKVCSKTSSVDRQRNR